MATITPTYEFPAKGVVIVTWANLANGDDGAWVDGVQYPEKSVQVYGTPGVGFSMDFEGSNATGTPTADQTHILNDPQGNALTFTGGTAERTEQQLENTYQNRPNVTAGDGSTDMNVKMTMVRKKEVSYG